MSIACSLMSIVDSILHSRVDHGSAVRALDIFGLEDLRVALDQQRELLVAEGTGVEARVQLTDMMPEGVEEGPAVVLLRELEEIGRASCRERV